MYDMALLCDMALMSHGWIRTRWQRLRLSLTTDYAVYRPKDQTGAVVGQFD